MISYILCQNCSRYSTLTAIVLNDNFPSNIILGNYIILKVHIKHITFFGIFTAYQPLSTLIFASVFLLPETCLHVHLKKAILNLTMLCRQCIWNVFHSSHQLICILNKYVMFECYTICCVLLWFRLLIITDIINISFTILCVSHLQSPVAGIILLCLLCSTNCFILR